MRASVVGPTPDSRATRRSASHLSEGSRTGTTLSKDAPAGKLTVSRARQVTIDGWLRPVKVKK